MRQLNFRYCLRAADLAAEWLDEFRGCLRASITVEGAMVATVRAGFAHQKLARLIADDGMELDVSALPRRPSGRIERAAADALFDAVRTELEDDPYNGRRWYRLARAYEYAGDRRRAREAMKTAEELQARQRPS